MCISMGTVSQSLQNLGLDVENVLNWTGRSKRERKPPALSYWQQFVETDDWYLRKLLEDVPPDEIDAACFSRRELAHANLTALRVDALRTAVSGAVAAVSLHDIRVNCRP